MRIKLIVSVVVLLIWTNAFAQDANDKKAFTAATKGLVGEWVNELGSPL